ncbi:MAG: M14 metallopeptidase family protein [Clostridia bacterium]
MKTPREHLGFSVGDDRKLADWNQITSYFEHLSSSDRMILQSFGKSTEDREMIYATISSPENLAELDKYKAIQKKLADPRSLSEQEADELIEQGKSIVLITCSIHATEVGGAQMSMELAYELMMRDDADVLEILENNIFLFVPSLNPDGLDLVVDWYKKTLGTKAEGTNPPFLYQKYTGHDNNRDWFMLTQKENFNIVNNIHNEWHPHIVHDQHQMGSNGFRFILPPFIDPYDPNVDKILAQQVNTLGTSMAAALTTNGKKGVATTVGFDAYSPSRAYQHYHGGVRILSEAASVKLATPIEIDFDEISGYGGKSAKEASYNHPEVWEGGKWSLRDIVEYDKIVAFACLQHAAKYRKDWVKNFYRIHKRAVERKDKPFAFIIPSTQRDPFTAYEMVKALENGLVEIEKAKEEFIADGIKYDAGSLIVKVRQPYGGYAKTLLEKQEYPDLRLYPGGPPKRPYDLTAQTLPLQMGVECLQIEKEFDVKKERIENIKREDFVSIYPHHDDGEWTYIRPETNLAFKLINELLADGNVVYRFEKETVGLPAGTFIVKEKVLKPITGIVGHIPPVYGTLRMVEKTPKIGLYKSHAPSADEGWTRFIFEEYGFDFENFVTQDITKDYLAKYDVIVLPQNRMPYLVEGLGDEYPEQYQGGLSSREMQVLLDYTKKGGTVLAFDNVAPEVIKHFYLPVENIVKTLKDEEFFIPGSFLKSVLDVKRPIAWGMERETSILFLRSPVFSVKGLAYSVGRYPGEELLLSGWILGEHHLQYRSNLVEVPVGKGKVYLYGMRPQFRAQARGTYKLVFNPIINSIMV